VSVSAEELVAKATTSLNPLEVPEILHASVEKHQKNLLGLAAALIVGGYDWETVETGLDAMFGSFRSEVTRVVFALNEGRDAR